MLNLRYLLLFFLIATQTNSQNSKVNDSNRIWYASLNVGVQMSGIKSEDFINSNYSPLIKASLGKWLTKDIAIQVGYQGRYFNAIADNYKHFYDFYFLEGVLDFKNLFFNSNKINKSYNLLFHGGFGFFQNRFYGNSSFHVVLGATNSFYISKKIRLNFDLSTIVGWDIYQGDEDILPNTSIGITYFFNK